MEKLWIWIVCLLQAKLNKFEFQVPKILFMLPSSVSTAQLLVLPSRFQFFQKYSQQSSSFHIFLAVWHENGFNICVGVLFLYILVINHTPRYILNSLSCQKNLSKRRGLPTPAGQLATAMKHLSLFLAVLHQSILGLTSSSTNVLIMKSFKRCRCLFDFFIRFSFL